MKKDFKRKKIKSLAGAFENLCSPKKKSGYGDF